MYQFLFQKDTLTPKGNASVNGPYSLNSYFIFFYIIYNITYWHNSHLSCFILIVKSYRPFYTATPLCIDYWFWTTGPNVAVISQHFFLLPIKWTDDGVKNPFLPLQCKMFNSETFLCVANVIVLETSHHLFDKPECSEKLETSWILE